MGQPVFASAAKALTIFKLLKVTCGDLI